MNKKVCFLLPKERDFPVGGYKVVYRYANMLIEEGFDVSIIYIYMPDYFYRGFLYKIFKHFIVRTWTKTPFKKPTWYKLSNKVQQKRVIELNENNIESADYYISTAFFTSISLDRLNNISSKQKYYFVQGYEAWGIVTPKDIARSYRFNMTKICIAPWLCDKVSESGASAIYIPNGFDLDEFYVTNPIEERKPATISILCAKEKVKNTKGVVKALNIVKKKYPELEVYGFGVNKRLKYLPDYINYIQKPSHEELVELYNKTAIYVGFPTEEGFGLTVGEAMLCGCTAIGSDNGGYQVMITNKENGILSPIGDFNKLAVEICQLIQDNKTRIEYARKGNDKLKSFSWNDSFKKLLAVLSK